MPIPDEIKQNRIGFDLRFKAFLVDAVFVLIGGGVAGVLLGGALAAGMAPAEGWPEGWSQREAAVGVAVIGAILSTFFFAAAYGLIEAFLGASPAKMLFGMKIAAPDGSPAPLRTLLLRYAIKHSPFLVAVLTVLLQTLLLMSFGNILGFVVAIGCFHAFSEDKTSLHDKLAGTAVYPRDYVPPRS